MDIIKLNDDEEMKKCFVCGYKLQCRTCHNNKKHKHRKKRTIYKIPVDKTNTDINEMRIIFEGYFNDGEIQNLSMIMK